MTRPSPASASSPCGNAGADGARATATAARPRRARGTAAWGGRAAAAAVALLLAVAAVPGMAREGDRRQPANIEADRVEIDRPAGISRYYGNVIFTQGTLRITGDRLSLRAPGGVVEHAEVHGEPATVRQETDAGEVVRANALHIVYEAAEGLTTLTGEAELLRDGERFAAEIIHYRPDTGRVEASRGDGGDRVQIRIEPEDGAGESDESATDESP